MRNVKPAAAAAAETVSVDDAARVGPEHGALCVVRLGVACGVVRAGSATLPHHVRRDTRADDGRAVLPAGPDGMRTVGVEPVTEAACRLVGQEAVLALPAGAVGAPERVDEDVAPVRVERDAEPGRAKAEYAAAAIR